MIPGSEIYAKLGWRKTILSQPSERVIQYDDGSVEIRYGDTDNPDDLRWFVVDSDVAREILNGLAMVYADEAH